MDYTVSINRRSFNHPGEQRAFPYDFAVLSQWQKSPTGSAEAAQRIRSWVEAGNRSETLDLGQLDLHSCPPLPLQVQKLCLAFNPDLDTLPQPLPEDLKDLNINFCNFTSLPYDWPVGLTRLTVVTNKVAEIPQTLPAGLQVLYLTNNRLRNVPTHLPDGLCELGLAANAITELAPGLFSLPNCKKLNLCNNPLLDASEAMLAERTSLPAYSGPAVKIGYVDESMDLSSWFPESRAAEMRASEGPPVIRRHVGDLTSRVNAMLRENPHHVVASYSDQHTTILQSINLRSLLSPGDASHLGSDWIASKPDPDQ